MVANIVGLPILLAPYSIGLFLLSVIAILLDGASEPSSWYVYSFIILTVSGAVMGAYLGHMQSFPLRTRLSQSGKWIAATSIGVAVGAPVSWLVYRWILESFIMDHPNSSY